MSELIANAFLHTEHAEGGDIFELELLCRAEGLRISLADGSSIRPIIAALDHDRPSGRGLRIVRSLAEAWGAEDHLGGKRVWVELRRD